MYNYKTNSFEPATKQQQEQQQKQEQKPIETNFNNDKKNIFKTTGAEPVNDGSDKPVKREMMVGGKSVRLTPEDMKIINMASMISKCAVLTFPVTAVLAYRAYLAWCFVFCVRFVNLLLWSFVGVLKSRNLLGSRWTRGFAGLGISAFVTATTVWVATQYEANTVMFNRLLLD